MLTAAQFGWEVGIHAFLVPYENRRAGAWECQLVPGWQGLVDLASRSGRASCWTGAVYEGDEFDYTQGDSPYIHHKSLAVEEIPEKLTHLYAVGRTTGAQWPVIEVWTIAKVRAHRDRYNRQGEKHYSYQHLEMYGRKVVLLQVLKYLPKSAELQNAIQLEHDTENDEPPRYREMFDGELLQLPQPEPQTAAAPEPEPALAPPEEKPQQSTVEAVKEELKKGKPAPESAQDIWPPRKKKEGKKDEPNLEF